jgi:ADP-heptose:LPS heptosyltransferase
MRWLDRWLGIPLCFLLSLGVWWRNRFASASAGGMQPRRVLCIQLAEMGSLVLAGPAVHWLRTRGVTPFVVSFARNRDCVALAGLAPDEHVFLWRTDNAQVFAADFLRFLRWAWQLRFDAAIDFEPCSRFSALLCLLAGARLRSGFAHDGAYRGRLYNLPVRYREDCHISENFLALAATLLPDESSQGIPGHEAAWREQLVAPGEVDAVPIARVLAQAFPAVAWSCRLILFNPNAGDLLPQRRWPAGRYVRLAQAVLQRHPEACVGFIGAVADDVAVSAMVAAVASPRCASLAGAVSVSSLPQLFARSCLLVSNDSGPAHIASLSQTPTLVLFGPETPRLYLPLGRARALYAALPCSPCIRPANQRRSSCQDNLCMQAIQVEDVLTEIDAMLDGDCPNDRRVASADIHPSMMDPA